MSKKMVPFKAAALSTAAALAVAAFAVTGVFAAGPTPTATSTQVSSAVLQGDWKVETGMLQTDTAIIGRFDRLLDLDRGMGGPVRFSVLKDMTVDEINGFLTKAEALVSSHAGFDSTGAVTDPATTDTTIHTLSQYLDQLQGQFLPQIRDQLRSGSLGRDSGRLDRF